MGYPAHKFLEEFGTSNDQLSDIVRALRPRIQPADDQRAKVEAAEAAYSRGYEEGRAAAQAAHAAEMADLRSDYEARMEGTSALFSTAVAETLRLELHDQIALVHSSISDQLTTALLPVLRHVLTEATVRELAGSLDDLLGEPGAITAELRGPQDMIDRVTARLRDMDASPTDQGNPRLKCVADETAALRITVNDTVIEARLMEWIKRIAAAVE